MNEIFLADEAATLAFGAKLASLCPAQCVIFLNGNLGVGKTTLVRGFLQGLGYSGNVKSPTYTLVESYDIKGKLVFHFDLYRLNNSEEIENIGLRDYLATPAVLLIEWPERGEGLLPTPDIVIHLEAAQAGRKLLLKVRDNLKNYFL